MIEYAAVHHASVVVADTARAHAGWAVGVCTLDPAAAESVGELIEHHFGPEEKEQIANMHLLWAGLRNEDGTGELDRAIERRDGAAVETILEAVAAGE